MEYFSHILRIVSTDLEFTCKEVALEIEFLTCGVRAQQSYRFSGYYSQKRSTRMTTVSGSIVVSSQRFSESRVNEFVTAVIYVQVQK